MLDLNNHVHWENKRITIIPYSEVLAGNEWQQRRAMNSKFLFLPFFPRLADTVLRVF